MYLELRDCTVSVNPCALIPGDVTGFPGKGLIRISSFAWGAFRISEEIPMHMLLGASSLDSVNISLGSGCNSLQGMPSACSFSNGIYSALLKGHRIQATIYVVMLDSQSGVTALVFKILLGNATEAFITGYQQSGYNGEPTPGTDNLVIRTCDVTMVHVVGGAVVKSGNLCHPIIATTSTTTTLTQTSTQDTTVTNTATVTNTVTQTTTVTNSTTSSVTSLTDVSVTT